MRSYYHPMHHSSHLEHFKNFFLECLRDPHFCEQDADEIDEYIIESAELREALRPYFVAHDAHQHGQY